jgi:hypothetical protein
MEGVGVTRSTPSSSSEAGSAAGPSCIIIDGKFVINYLYNVYAMLSIISVNKQHMYNVDGARQFVKMTQDLNYILHLKNNSTPKTFLRQTRGMQEELGLLDSSSSDDDEEEVMSSSANDKKEEEATKVEEEEDCAGTTGYLPIQPDVDHPNVDVNVPVGSRRIHRPPARFQQQRLSSSSSQVNNPVTVGTGNSQQHFSSSSSSPPRMMMPTSPKISLSKFLSLRREKEQLESQVKQYHTKLENLQEKVTLLDYGISFKKRSMGPKHSPLKLKKSISDIVLDSLKAPILTFPQKRSQFKIIRPRKNGLRKERASTCKCLCFCGKTCSSDAKKTVNDDGGGGGLFHNVLKRPIPPISDDMWKELKKRHKAEFIYLFGDNKKTGKENVNNNGKDGNSSNSESQRDTGDSSNSSSSSSSFPTVLTLGSGKIALALAKATTQRAQGLQSQKSSQVTKPNTTSQNPAPTTSTSRTRRMELKIKEIERIVTAKYFLPQPSRPTLSHYQQKQIEKPPVLPTPQKQFGGGGSATALRTLNNNYKTLLPQTTVGKPISNSINNILSSDPSIPIFNKEKNTWEVNSVNRHHHQHPPTN